MEKKFAVIHDLGTLSEEQRKQYLRDASVFLGLDPNLNGLDLIWLNTEEGIRRLTAYARRGTTDLLREIHGITVSSLDQHDGPGYVSFKATGTNKAGRQEIAVGAAFLEGLKGDRVAAQVATAQTRALRRLTLQFVGLAVLDESEVNAFSNVTPQNTSLSQLALAPVALVAPSNEPGKDITEVKATPDEIIKQKVIDIMANPTVHNALGTVGDPSGVVAALCQATGQDPATTLNRKSQEEFEAHQAKLRADAIAQLNQEAGTEPTHHEPAVDIPQPKKTRKPRSPNKPKVDLGPSEPVPTPASIAQAVVILPTVTEAKLMIEALRAPEPPLVAIIAPIAAPAPPSAPVAPAASPTLAKPRLTPEQVKPFRQRLFRLVNDQLEPNGFMPKEGMGNADKMRSLAIVMFPSVQNMNDLTEAQWGEYLNLLERKIQEEGPANTVKYIEDVIGI
jgi:hypothetical protein